MKNYEEIFRRLLEERGIRPGEDELKLLVDELEQHQLQLESTNRTLTEEKGKLEKSLATYHDLYDFAPIGYITFDENGIILSINSTGASMLGVDRPELIGTPFDNYLKIEDRGNFNTYLLNCRYETGLVTCDVHLAVKPEQEILVQLFCSIGGAPENGSVFYHTAMIDVSEQKRAETALRRSEKKFRTLFEGMRDGIFIYSPEVKLTDVNPAGLEMLGYSKEDGRIDELDLQMHHDPESRERFRSMLRDNLVEDLEVELKGKENRTVTVHASGSAIRDEQGNITGYRVFMHDLTGYKRLEQQLFQAQKLESIGLLAGGIAHDFNNLLTAILGYGETIQESIAEPDELVGMSIEKIRESALRAQELTGKLLAFSRKQVINPQPVPLNDIITGVTSLLTRIMGEDIEFDIRLSDAGMVVMADSVQIGQVLANLATNARDAMPAGGKFIVETKEITVNDTLMAAVDLEAPGQYAKISVTDTGTGMDDGQMKKLFDPFFTTKEIGRGTGLGLPISYGIMKQHRGSIVAWSTPGRGATFELYLPLTDVPAPEKKPPLDLAAAAGNECILVAEDEEVVRTLLCKMLERAGYRVISAADGNEAIMRFEENRDSVALVLSDVVMPHKTGREIYDEINRLKPETRIIFISGYTADIIHTKGILEAGIDFITKPFSKQDLLQKIREVLER